MLGLHMVYLKVLNKFKLSILDLYFHSQIVIDLLLPSPIIFSALTVMRYKVSHNTLWKVTLVSNDTVIDDVKL